ncbi:hypothetical protein [Mycobacterium sp. E1747]|uniref:hypothetical protein n=1 Tax=Mycobacterium sp. E1747 TaxID=1834128 RepID=UPI000801F9E3|nr:hypothetical protein [Mycobacterium sp. E1747]OBH05935.1 hypothetical protein A5695_06795 [Mycobacterium sp. E1747]
MAITSDRPGRMNTCPQQGAGAPDKIARFQHCDLIAAAAGAALLVVIGVLSGWAHYSLSTAHRASPNTAAPPASTSQPPVTPQRMSAQLRAWLAEAQPSIEALVAARHEIASAAADDDLARTGATCQNADGAVTSLERYLPSPDPALNTVLQQATNSYHVGLRYCISGVQKYDGNDIMQAVTYINQGTADLQRATDTLQHDPANLEPHDPNVMTV